MIVMLKLIVRLLSVGHLLLLHLMMMRLIGGVAGGVVDEAVRLIVSLIRLIAAGRLENVVHAVRLLIVVGHGTTDAAALAVARGAEHERVGIYD